MDTGEHFTEHVTSQSGPITIFNKQPKNLKREGSKIDKTEICIGKVNATETNGKKQLGECMTYHRNPITNTRYNTYRRKDSPAKK